MVLISAKIKCRGLIYFYHMIHQGCSPRELGLDLESTRDRFFVVLVSVLVLRAVVLVLVLRLSVLVLDLVSKDWSRTFFETSYKLWSSVEMAYYTKIKNL